MPAPKRFTDAYATYQSDIARASAEGRLEAQHRYLFFGFLSRAFEIEIGDVTLEQPVRIGSNQRKGFVDALFGDLVFEFKRHLKNNPTEARDQLRDYLRTLSANRPYVGMLTDGIRFEVHVLRDGALVQTDSFDIETADAETAFIRLDSYLFSQKQLPPTAEDVVRRFGGDSATFQSAFNTLKALLARVSDDTALAVWRDQWGKLLSKVYGSEIQDDDLFLRHTYLCQFAKLLAYAALRGLPSDNPTAHSIISGDAFNGQGVSNIGEHDFFSWVLLEPIREEAVTLFRRLGESLVVYDLSKIDQDLLKQLYQNLVDPATRHELGEFYTPDWLAELTLQDINYHHPQSLLDPACGSGSFLFAAIKHLAANGLTGLELVRFAVGNIMGMDVHPLAVTVARINYLLALSDHLRGAKTGELLAIPVFMADALAAPELERKLKDTLVVPVDESRNESFFIPVSAAADPDALTHVIDEMHQFARRAGDPLKLESFKPAFETLVRRRFEKNVSAGVVGDMSIPYWQRNLSLLTKLILEDRNGIWGYILKNQSRPLVLAERKFDVVVGNPPWLSYRFIRSKTYQKEVKALYQHYKLIDSGDTKLFTQMDLSSLFFAHARARYLRPGGTLAFVMPRSVITGAKQHRPFQAIGFSRVIDLLGVEPLFNVPSCVVIAEPTRQPHPLAPSPQVERGDNAVPAVHYTGTLRAHELSLPDALPSLTRRETVIHFVDSDIRSPYYYERFMQGATLVPRNLCFVKPEGIPGSPAVMTDPEADREAKKPWKGITMRGVVEDDYIYATLLSKHLIPFGYEKLHMVALPARVTDDGLLKMLTRERDFMESGHFRSYDWFQSTWNKWDSLKKEASAMSLSQRYDYQKLLVRQSPGKTIKVLYTASGVHLAACVIDISAKMSEVYSRHTQGFVIDHKTYYWEASSADEAHYLSALLNAPSVDDAIKAYQSRGKGKVGERDIHRTPFEACAIPPFDPANPDHLELARLSQSAHATIDALKASGSLSGGVVTIRRKARAATAEQITAIDAIARRILGL